MFKRLGQPQSRDRGAHFGTGPMHAASGPELLVGPDSGSAPVHMVAGAGLWLRFTGGGHGWRWSIPMTPNPTVARLRVVLRCPGGTVVAQVHALAAGSTELHATLSSNLPSPPRSSGGA